MGILRSVAATPGAVVIPVQPEIRELEVRATRLAREGRSSPKNTGARFWRMIALTRDSSTNARLAGSRESIILPGGPHSTEA